MADEDGRGTSAGLESVSIDRDKISLAEWLEANLSVTGDQSDVVTQADVLALMRDPRKGWKSADRHKAKRIKHFIKGWCSSKQVFWGDGKFMQDVTRVHHVHGRGLVFKHASDCEILESESSECDTPPAEDLQHRCSSCDSIDLLIDGLCVRCSSVEKTHIRKEACVRKLFDENGLVYSSHNKAIGEGRFRPDFVFNAQTHFVVVEVDENQHKSYCERAERERMLSIQRTLGRPTVFVRYNPDSYAPGEGSVPVGLPIREAILVEWVKRLVVSNRVKRAEVLRLFFDGFVTGFEKLQKING
jgi:hypothetical protein